MNVLDDPRLEECRLAFADACRASRLHDSDAERALVNYGDHGPRISGCVRDHFPESVKESLRQLARLVTIRSEAAWSARPPRIRNATMRKLASAVARRDGSGFYGPQP